MLQNSTAHSLLAEAPFRPTAYTAALLACSLARLRRQPARQGLELGVGGGYVMAALLQAGVSRFHGVDVLADAIRSTSDLLDTLGLGARATLAVGDLWQAVARHRFDLIVTNLPQFPVDGPLDEQHPSVWSDGGPDGRRLIDPFIDDLADHLAPGGAAFMTHNVFVDMDRSIERLRSLGMEVHEAGRTLVPLTAERAAMLGRNPRYRGAGLRPHGQDGLVRVGPQMFAAFCVLEVRQPGRLARQG